MQKLTGFILNQSLGHILLSAIFQTRFFYVDSNSLILTNSITLNKYIINLNTYSAHFLIAYQLTTIFIHGWVISLEIVLKNFNTQMSATLNEIYIQLVDYIKEDGLQMTDSIKLNQQTQLSNLLFAVFNFKYSRRSRNMQRVFYKKK